MRMIRTAPFLLILLNLSLNLTWAAPARQTEAPRLYVLEKAALPPVSRELVPDAAEEYSIEVDPAAVSANPPAFQVELPDSVPLLAVRTRFVTYKPDWKSWFGTLRDSDASGEGTGFIYLGYHGDRMTALIEFGGERYRIVGGGPGEKHRLVRLSGALSPPPCGLDEAADASEPPSFRPGEKPFEKGIPALKIASRIDVLVVYPRAFFSMSSAEGSLFTFAQDSISIANNAFANSGINAFYNLVGVVPILDSQPTSGIFASLDWLNSEPAEVTTLRNAFGADVISVYVPFEWNSPNACGVANLPQAGGGYISGSSFHSGFGDKAYSANRNGCGLNDYTLAHEVGHNYGMRHEDDPNNSLTLFPYGRGHLLTVSGVQKATIMGCTCGASPKPPCGLDISNAVCNRILYFSDPNILYQGVPTGVAPSGSDPGRNNALVGRNQVGSYSGFRPQSANTPPTAAFTVSCCGRLCTFNAGSSTDNAPLPTDASSYWWDFGDGTTGTGKSSGRAYAVDGSYTVHLVVYDSGGQTDVSWRGLSAFGNCPVPPFL
jgi:PKD domain-containing protein/reprolysin-like metallo-peptidase family M12B